MLSASGVVCRLIETSAVAPGARERTNTVLLPPCAGKMVPLSSEKVSLRFLTVSVSLAFWMVMVKSKVSPAYTFSTLIW